MGDFAKWYVKGDGGLMEDFTSNTVYNIVSQVFKEYEAAEKERKRKEEDERSWAEAREHQVYNLSLKYLYRWRRIAKKLAQRRILREGKEKMRLFREQQRVEKRRQKEESERVEQEKRTAIKRRMLEDGRKLSELARSQRGRKRTAAEEDMLLATGIFSGLPNERDVARRVVYEAENAPVAFSVPESDSEESELELVPAPKTSMPPPPRRFPTASGRLQSQQPSRESSTERREGWKTRSLREKLGLSRGDASSRGRSASIGSHGSAGSSMTGVDLGSSFASSKTDRFRQSLPSSMRPPKVTNFSFASSVSRKRSAEESSDDDRDAKRKTAAATTTQGGFKSTHWDLRTRGFVPTPDGNWLPESMVPAANRSRNGGSPPLSNVASAREEDVYSDAEGYDDEQHGRSQYESLQLRLAGFTRSVGSRHHRAGSMDIARSSPARSVSRGRPRGAAAPATGAIGAGTSPSPSPRPYAAAATKRRRDESEGVASPPESKKFNAGAGGAVSRGPIGGEETQRSVQNTMKMLRELREAMDKADEDDRARMVVG